MDPSGSPDEADAASRHRNNGVGAGSGLGDTSIAEVLGFVGFAFLLAAWHAFAQFLSYDERTDRYIEWAAILGAAGPAVVLSGVGLVLLGRADRWARRGELILFVAGFELFGTVNRIGLALSGDEQTTLAPAAGVASLLVLATLARWRRDSVLTLLGVLMTLLIAGSLVGERLVADIYGIDLFGDRPRSTGANGVMVFFVLTLGALWIALAGLAFLIARREGAAEPAPDRRLRVLLADTTAAVAAVGGMAFAIAAPHGVFEDFYRPIPVPASTLIFAAMVAALVLVGLRLRAPVYFYGAGFAIAVAVVDVYLAISSPSSLNSWLLAAVGAVLLAGGLALSRIRSTLPGQRQGVETSQEGLEEPARGSRGTRRSLRGLADVSLREVLVLLGIGFVLAAWHAEIGFANRADLRSAIGLANFAVPAVALGIVGLVLLGYDGWTARIAGVLMLVAGVEASIAGDTLFVLMTGNDSGAGPAVGAIYWLALAVAGRRRRRAVLTQLGLLIALGVAGAQLVAVLGPTLFGQAEYDIAPGTDEEVLASRDPGVLLPLAYAVGAVLIAIPAFVLGRIERRADETMPNSVVISLVTDVAASLLLVAGVTMAITNDHLGYDRALLPPATTLVLVVVAVALFALSYLSRSGVYLYGAGLAIFFAVSDLNSGPTHHGADEGDIAGVALLIEGAVIVAVAAAIELTRRTLLRRRPVPAEPRGHAGSGEDASADA